MSKNVLRVDGSMRHDGSFSRQLADRVADRLAERHGPLSVTRRDLADGAPFVDAAWIGANFTPADARTPEQRAALTTSDALVAELKAADILVLATPIYNFGPPAALKAWIDMVARVGETFKYSEAGPKGLLEIDEAYLVVASGGTAIDSTVDFATPYLRHALGFIGVENVHLVGADGREGGDALLSKGEAQISDLFGAAA